MGRASVGRWLQQWLLRHIKVLLFRHTVFEPTFLQPAWDCAYGGSFLSSVQQAKVVWVRLEEEPSLTLYIGSVTRYVGLDDDMGPVIPLRRHSGCEGPRRDMLGLSWLLGEVSRVGGFMHFVGAKGLLISVPNTSPAELCPKCTATGAEREESVHGFVDCPRR